MKNLKITTFLFAVLLAGSLGACKKKDAGGSGGGIGVPECDDYFARMASCAKGKGGPQLNKMADMMRGAWKDDAKDAEKKKGLADVCKQAVKDMAKQLPDCDWGVPAAPATPPAGSDTGSAAAPAGSDTGSAAAPAGSGSAAAPAGSGSAK